jgi:hypothetical protein
MRGIGLTLVYLWVFPTSAVGLLAYFVGKLGGARAQLREGVLEVHGPGVRRLLSALPVVFQVQAITFGHVVLGRDPGCLDRTRVHERVHVEQCRRWGPFFLPAYLLASAWAWLRGGDPYRDNRFEREAYAIADLSSAPPSG